VPKKNGKKKIVQDYQYLNSLIIKNNYPLPLISDLINNIKKIWGRYGIVEESLIHIYYAYLKST